MTFFVAPTHPAKKENGKTKNKLGEIMTFEDFFSMKISCDLRMI